MKLDVCKVDIVFSLKISTSVKTDRPDALSPFRLSAEPNFFAMQFQPGSCHQTSGDNQTLPDKTYHVCNKQSGKILDVEYGEAKTGNPVIMWEKKDPPVENQLWKFEPCEGYYHIVSCLDDKLVLTFKENPNGCGYYATICEKLQPPHPSQLFLWCGDNIACLMGQNMCLDVECAKTCDGALVVMGLQSGLVSQHWKVEECCVGATKPGGQEPTPLEVPQGFFIENNAIGRVFTILNDQIIEGTHVVSSEKKDPPNVSQLWKMTDAGNGYYYIESFSNPNLVLDIEQGNPNAVGQHLIVWQKKTDGNANQLFRWNGNLLETALNPSLVLDIENPWDMDGSKILTANAGNEHSKSWNMIPTLFHTGI